MQEIVAQRGRVQSAPHLRLLTWEGSDAELLDLVEVADSSASARFHDRFGSDVHALVRALVGPDPACGRLVEASLLAAYSDILHSNISVGQLSARVEQHTVNVVRSHLRQRWWWRLLRSNGSALDNRSPEQVFSFYDALASMRPDWRIAFCLSYVAGRALSDIARLCHCSVSEVRRHLFRAESQLREAPPAGLYSDLGVGWES
jgi:DNA-directed RNA polymerase specialized sigma24 family protein